MSHTVWLHCGSNLAVSPHWSILGSKGLGGSPIPSGKAELSQNLLPKQECERAETRGSVQSNQPRTFPKHWKPNTFGMLLRWLSRTAPVLASHVCTCGVWSPATPSSGSIPSCQRNPYHCRCEGLCVKNKTTVLSKNREGFPGEEREPMPVTGLKCNMMDMLL